MHLAFCAGLAAAVLISGSCADKPSQPAQRVARDSSGVRIVDLSADILHQLPILTVDAPSVKIGVAEGTEQHQLFQVRGVRQLSDGSILVLNSGTHELRRFDATGEWLSSSGRQGGGPGEMQFPVLLARGDADTSFIYDLTRRAFHVVDPAGDIVGSRTVSTSLSGFVGLLDHTTAVVADPRFPRNIYERVVTADVTVATVDLLQSSRDTLLRLSGFQEYRYAHGELVRTVPVPFTIKPAVAVGEEQIYVTDGDSPELRIYGRAGALREIVRFDLAAVPVGAADWENAVRATMETRARTVAGEARLAPAELTRQREIFAAMSLPATQPFFDKIVLANGGGILLRQFSPLADEQRWIALDSAGGAFATALMPRRIDVREITDGWVLGQEVDQLDVEYVVVYALTRSR